MTEENETRAGGDAGGRGRSPSRTWVAIIVLCVVAGGFFFARSRKSDHQVLSYSGDTMGTTYSVTIVDRKPRPGNVDAMKRAVAGELDLVNSTMSRHRKDSELFKFNSTRSTEPFPMSRSALRVIDRALKLSERTGGAYDVTVSPLVRFWGFTDRNPRLTMPTDEEIDAILATVGYDKVKVDLDAGTLTKTRPDVEIDLSSIAKGAGVDRVAKSLEIFKHKDYMVEVGGEIRCRGKSPRGTPWRVGIEAPVDDRREIYEVLELTDVSMATSGDYRAFYDLEGKRLSHTIDPRTGRPVEHGIASVTVIHDECMVADALATALTVLGPEEGYALAVEEGLKALFLVRKPGGGLEEKATEGFQQLRNNKTPEKK